MKNIELQNKTYVQHYNYYLWEQTIYRVLKMTNEESIIKDSSESDAMSNVAEEITKSSENSKSSFGVYYKGWLKYMIYFCIMLSIGILFKNIIVGFQNGMMPYVLGQLTGAFIILYIFFGFILGAIYAAIREAIHYGKNKKRDD